MLARGTTRGWRALAAGALAVLALNAAHAQAPAPIETTTPAGDRILLYPDGRWEYADPAKRAASPKPVPPAAATPGDARCYAGRRGRVSAGLAGPPLRGRRLRGAGRPRLQPGLPERQGPLAVRVLGVILGVLVLGAGYFWVVLSWNYSTGERAGWVQKFSKKGWLCKTWEGEMAMVSMPGTTTEKFFFTVWDDAVAEQINKAMGKRVSLHYEEKIGLPTSCFGETRHFVTGVTRVEEIPLAPGIVVPTPQPPVAPPAAPAAPAK